MKRIIEPVRQHRSLWVRWGVFGVVLLLAFSPVLLLTTHTGDFTLDIVLFIPALLVALLAYRLADNWVGLVSLQQSLLERLHLTETHLEDARGRLSVTLSLSRVIAEAKDENSLMEAILPLVSHLCGAAGASYTPLDDLGQPLVSIQIGQVPEAVRSEWGDYLSSPAIQEACRSCQLRHSGVDLDCPLLTPIYSPSRNIYCLALQRSDHLLGMINLYLPDGASPSEDLAQFMDGLVGEIVLSIETLRHRAQEMATLNQIQLVRAPHMDLGTALAQLLENARQPLEADFALISLRSLEKIPQQVIFANEASRVLDTPVVQGFAQAAMTSLGLSTFVSGGELKNLPEGVGAVLVAPLLIPGSAALGALVVGNTQPHPFYPRQYKVVQTIASQAALLVENERLVVELEYRAIMEERSRLAREIHDGLAQTLAFLKLQANQMQSFLVHGDMDRLASALRKNIDTLTTAYLDTRQSIDNLRVKPEADLRHWLGQVGLDFQEATGIPVIVNVSVDPLGFPPEVQAQLIRVVQEAFSNIRKHAHAHQVHLSLRGWGEDLILEISDDGQGFSPEDIPTVSQYGLRGMRERAELIGADFQIISQPEQGTTVRLRLPYRFEQELV